ncbi:hypothetical protein CSHISOI_10896 [Colletotrichum shisoi]|uniref:Uncharacterized protein n=1 Tax=Colletotrichum shisoi TaxID=2078593 RepID=A0A5Q4BCH1_9PEZI|nr:hypothetical protein CSHISOI_10896 [Colletotrichum shisoi]
MSSPSSPSIRLRLVRTSCCCVAVRYLTRVVVFGKHWTPTGCSFLLVPCWVLRVLGVLDDGWVFFAARQQPSSSIKSSAQVVPARCTQTQLGRGTQPLALLLVAAAAAALCSRSRNEATRGGIGESRAPSSWPPSRVCQFCRRTWYRRLYPRQGDPRRRLRLGPRSLCWCAVRSA